MPLKIMPGDISLSEVNVVSTRHDGLFRRTKVFFNHLLSPQALLNLTNHRGRTLAAAAAASSSSPSRLTSSGGVSKAPSWWDRLKTSGLKQRARARLPAAWLASISRCWLLLTLEGGNLLLPLRRATADFAVTPAWQGWSTCRGFEQLTQP
jgi:hypothetical protein